jgi:hypothetical protein
MASNAGPVPARSGAPPTVGSTGEEEPPAGRTSAEHGPLVAADKLDRRSRRSSEQRGRRTPGDGLLDRCAGRGLEPQHAGNPLARLVQALDGGGGKGAAADRGLEQLTYRVAEPTEVRQPQRDLTRDSRLHLTALLEQPEQVAGRLEPGVREAKGRTVTHNGLRLSYPLDLHKSLMDLLCYCITGNVKLSA